MRPIFLGALMAAGLALAGCQTALDRVNGALLPDLHKNMSAEDTRLAALAMNRALEGRPAGEGVEWRNPRTRLSGSFTPERTFQTETGHFCRDFTEILKSADGRRASYPLTSCRGSHGAWLVQ